jgi:Uma2 family endonuclease
VPDLVGEVLSPSNRSHDLVKKKDLYEKFGVKEYWTIDPETKTTMGYTLNSGKYESMTTEPASMDSALLKVRFSF